MTQRVRVVTGEEIAAEDLSNFLTRTVLGGAILCYGLYRVVDWLTLLLLKQDLGIGIYIVAPLGILFSGFFLLCVAGYSINIQDPLIRWTYYVVGSYFITNALYPYGVFGSSSTGKYIGYAIVFCAIAVVYRALQALFANHLRVREVSHGLFCIAALVAVAIGPFWQTTRNILLSAGWIG
ncbi:hypothetical protein VST7929_02748 [Vibrio stylophorae]|uniref:Uncharacterized protein n=1 Tax=Vibrio stylophorae TaxID=659351 RepID=A0ABM8ZWY4_9VIBR|nr:hypothetical protein [Vibrio stylophorae]CAH0535087.1 hypothetical protein VST7929_02748 [Vibrio stylophorae]